MQPTPVTCLKRHLEARCIERGYTLDAVRPCIVRQDGDRITVDTSHAAYPRQRVARTVATQRRAVGPGTELKRLLSKIGITATPNCSCNARAKRMDQGGCDWCEANLDEIVGWLREEATKRGLPFLDAAGRVLVRRAITNARKEAARAGGSPRQD